MILLDTNILTRITQAQNAQSTVARDAVRALLARREQLIVVPQNLYEFWVVATRASGPPPDGRNGSGMTPEQAGQWLRFFRRRFTLLPDRDEICSLWQDLVEQRAVKGFRAHDARLVAAMQSYGITHLLTFNPSDFRDLPVAVLDPGAI